MAKRIKPVWRVQEPKFPVFAFFRVFRGHNICVNLRFLLLCFLCVHATASDNWPQFRGPHGDGRSDGRGLPLTWSETNHVKWKTAMHGRSWSSPVIWGDQVWLTTATEDGLQLFALCVDRETGRIVQDLKLFELEKQPDIRKYNTYASPTPVIEEGRVYVTFGSPATACLDTKTGKVLWRGATSSAIITADPDRLQYSSRTCSS